MGVINLKSISTREPFIFVVSWKMKTDVVLLSSLESHQSRAVLKALGKGYTAYETSKIVTTTQEQ